MIKQSRNSLGIIHAAITDPVARNVLGALSPSDLEMLSGHAAAGTLMPALQHLIEHDKVGDAIAAMPDDFVVVAKKLPPSALLGVTASLAALPADDDGSVPCGCHPYSGE